jgi:hypothetical protein
MQANVRHGPTVKPRKYKALWARGHLALPVNVTGSLAWPLAANFRSEAAFDSPASQIVDHIRQTSIIENLPSQRFRCGPGIGSLLRAPV